MKALKWIGVIILIIIVILIVLPFVIPVNSFRPTIEARASDALGRKVTVGNLSLSILGGSLGMDNLAIADDPKFNSGPFLTAKSVKVGVELLPLIFSKQLNVTGVSIANPQVMLLKNPEGKWNFSSIGGTSGGGNSAQAQTPAQAQPENKAQPAPSGNTGSSSNNAQAISIQKLSLENGQVTLGNTNSQKRSVYSNVNLTASDVSMTSNFPVTFSMDLPGGGTTKLDGKVGPVDQSDAALTPMNAKLNVSNLNLASTGFLDPSLGLAGMVDVNADVASQAGKANVKGQLTLSKAVLIAGGSPSSVPAVADFNTTYDLANSSGVLNPSTLKIGNAKTDLSGTYKSVGDEFVVDMKVNGQGLPATDLQNFLPALAINVPSGSKLTAGTLSTDLHVMGPTNKLVTDGTIGLFNAKLAGFNLGQKMSSVAALGGLKTGNDLDIQKFTSNVHMAPTGLQANNLDLVVPALGTVVGAGTLDSKNNMDFKLVATVAPAVLGNSAVGSAAGSMGGMVGQVLGGGGKNCKSGGLKVPLQVKGTTANPQFVPDVGGAAASMFKSELACVGGSGNPAGAVAGGNPASVINQLGGLLGKKKKP